MGGGLWEERKGPSQARQGWKGAGAPLPHAPVGVDEGAEAEPVTPAVGEVGDVDIGVTGRLPSSPEQQSFLGRQ